MVEGLRSTIPIGNIVQQLLNMIFQHRHLKLGHPTRVGVNLEKRNQNQNKR